MTANGDPPELALSAAWHAGRFAAPLRTTDGQTVEVVHRGQWCAEFGRRASAQVDGGSGGSDDRG